MTEKIIIENPSDKLMSLVKRLRNRKAELRKELRNTSSTALKVEL